MSEKKITAKIPKITKPIIVNNNKNRFNSKTSTPKKVIATNDARIRR